MASSSKSANIVPRAFVGSMKDVWTVLVRHNARLGVPLSMAIASDMFTFVDHEKPHALLRPTPGQRQRH